MVCDSGSRPVYLGMLDDPRRRTWRAAALPGPRPSCGFDSQAARRLYSFSTSRSNTNCRIAWATKFLWVVGLRRHSAAQCGLGVRERPWTSSHAGRFERAQSSCLSLAISPMWPDPSMPRWSWLRNSTSPKKKRHRRAVRHALGPEPGQAPDRRTWTPSGEQALQPYSQTRDSDAAPARQPALRRRTGPTGRTRAGRSMLGKGGCQPRTKQALSARGTGIAWAVNSGLWL